MNEVIFDSSQLLQCENCERIFEPEEDFVVYGLLVPEGENFFIPYCLKCARFGERLSDDLKASTS